jgi:hypothetical protein
LTAEVSFIRTPLHIGNYTSESLVTRLYSLDPLYIHIKTNVSFKRFLAGRINTLVSTVMTSCGFVSVHCVAVSLHIMTQLMNFPTDINLVVDDLIPLLTNPLNLLRWAETTGSLLP